MDPSEAPNLEGVKALIRTLVGGLAGADVAHDTPLSQAGLDSLAFVELRNELSRYQPSRLVCCHMMSLPLPVVFCMNQ